MPPRTDPSVIRACIAALACVLALGPSSGCAPTPAPRSNTPTANPARGWTLDRQPVPTTLEEAIETLRRGLGDGTIAYLRAAEEDIAIRLVPTLGRWMQEHWGLWSGGALRDHLEALGLDRPDDMAAVILTSFWRRLHFRDLRVEEQVRWYVEH